MASISSQKITTVADLHCDLLTYLAMGKNSSIHSQDVIGASYPFLKAGNVSLQVCAVFCLTQAGSYHLARKQAEIFTQLIEEEEFRPGRTLKEFSKTTDRLAIALHTSMENASGLLEEDESIHLLQKRLEEYIATVGKPLYISFTHHLANRFGGGNYSENLPLAKDGEALLALLDGRKIAVDLSHTSDALAEGILTEIEKQRYEIPIIASHSNFRAICDHPRNLPDEFAKEIVHRKGLIGINFVRDFVGPDDPKKLFSHIHYGMEEIGAKDVLAFGADFFDETMIQHPERIPYFHPEHQNASKYPEILQEMLGKSVGPKLIEKIASQNFMDFLARLEN
ncbi:MAG: membrane dipeptidase [Bacteroidota bacterium]